MRQLRVLQFITPAGFYGAERWIIALANNLPNEQIVCDLAVTRESDTQNLAVAEYYPEHAGKVHYLPMKGRFDLRAVLQLVKVIRKRQIEIIHTHGYKSDILGLVAARLAGIKCISTPHGFSGKAGLKLGAFIKLGTFMLRYFDAVVPLSEELVKDMEHFGVNKSKTHFIRNGVDLKEIDLALKESQDAHEGPIDSAIRTIGFIGQMIPRKGLSDLLQSFDRLYKRHPQCRLQLVGDGHQREELEKQAANLESENAIQFLGFRSDRLAILSQFDLFVMTSSLEGIPRCMMEAMAVGIPVVAYDIPGVDQLINHEETGLLVSLGDMEALADSCERVLEDEPLAQSLSTAARSRIDNDYSATRMAREYETLFHKLLGGSESKVASDEGAG